MRAAAGPLAGVSLELGGNDPAIVLESARLDDEMVEQLRHAVYTGTGQICFAVKRIYVARRHHDELVARFLEATDEIVVGNGLDERSTIGPLISDAARDRVRGLIERAASAGGTVTELGRALDPSSWADGSFLLPHVVTGLPHASELVGVEQFGPVVPIVPFDGEDEAIAMANDSSYGLSASIWSQDVDHAMALGREVDAGTVWVNVHRMGASDHTTPYGGTKSQRHRSQQRVGLGRGADRDPDGDPSPRRRAASRSGLARSATELNVRAAHRPSLRRSGHGPGQQARHQPGHGTLGSVSPAACPDRAHGAAQRPHVPHPGVGGASRARSSTRRCSMGSAPIGCATCWPRMDATFDTADGRRSCASHGSSTPPTPPTRSLGSSVVRRGGSSSLDGKRSDLTGPHRFTPPLDATRSSPPARGASAFSRSTDRAVRRLAGGPAGRWQARPG